MRKFSALFVAGLLMVAVVGCSTKKSEDVSAGSSTTEADSGDETTTTKAGSSTTDGGSSSGSDSSDDIPALGDLGDCLEVSLTYAGLFLNATFATDEQLTELEQSLDEIKGKVPTDIQDDLDVIAQGLQNADGIIEMGEFMDSDEFKEADANIQQYFEETCNTDSGN